MYFLTSVLFFFSLLSTLPIGSSAEYDIYSKHGVVEGEVSNAYIRSITTNGECEVLTYSSFRCTEATVLRLRIVIGYKRQPVSCGIAKTLVRYDGYERMYNEGISGIPLCHSYVPLTIKENK